MLYKRSFNTSRVRWGTERAVRTVVPVLLRVTHFPKRVLCMRNKLTWSARLQFSSLFPDFSRLQYNVFFLLGTSSLQMVKWTGWERKQSQCIYREHTWPLLSKVNMSDAYSLWKGVVIFLSLIKLKWSRFFPVGCLLQATVRFSRFLFLFCSSSSTQNDKFDWRWNPLDSWNYYYFQTLCDSAILARTQGAFCDSAILARRGNKQKVRHFRGHFDIVHWIEHHLFRFTHRTNDRILCSLSLSDESNQRVQQPNLGVHPAHVPNT